MDGVTVKRGDAGFGLDKLDDEALLAGTRRLVGRTNQTLALLLAHLAEVEARGIHRVRACASLCAYCVYELRMSEDAAFRRAKAARLCREFPRLYDAVAAGELHLTGLLMLGPHLTDENQVEVLARAKHRTKREIAKLVRQLDPLPDVPARVEPLGPEPGIASPRNPTWSELVASFSPVRELAPGARPRDWAEDATGDDGGAVVAGDAAAVADAEAEQDGDGLPSALAAPQRYKVQFTASQEYVDLLERARDLLAHAVPGRSIEEVHLRALRALVAALEKKKFAATDKPRRRGGSSPPDTDPRPRLARDSLGESAVQRRRDNNQPAGDSKVPRRRGAIPAAVRRAVRERDGARCAYVDANGQRCRETALLEFHHEQPFARGGPATLDNLELRCRAHNALAAEHDFGRALVERQKGRAARGP